MTVETPGAGEQNFWNDLYTGISKKDVCQDISLPIEYGYEQGIGADSLGTVGVTIAPVVTGLDAMACSTYLYGYRDQA